MKTDLLNKIEKTNWDQVVINISGGKDSSALMAWAVDNFPKEKLVCIHAVIDIDWKETRGVVQSQADHFGLPVVFVQAVDKFGKIKGFIDQLLAKRKNRKTGIIGEYQFPGTETRWCTSVLKTGPINKWIRNNCEGNILSLIGERHEESPKREKLIAWRPNADMSKSGRNVVVCSPILELLEDEVWKIIGDLGIPEHPCYKKFGVSRASCAICIFSKDFEIKAAAKYAPEVVAKYLWAEKQIKHTFRYKKATKSTPEIKQTVQMILDDQGVHFEFGGER